MQPEPIRVTLLVIDALEKLDIPYVIGGSMASSFHGVVRSTNDSDILADIKPNHVQPLAQTLRTDFYLDEQAIAEAIRRKSHFNLIHLKTMFKVDIFMPRRPFDARQLARRQPFPLSPKNQRVVYVDSPEDVILAKLAWYKMGGEVSERQWRDVLGILSLQQGRLDMSYLRQTAAQLSVASLLERALEQSRLE